MHNPRWRRDKEDDIPTINDKFNKLYTMKKSLFLVFAIALLGFVACEEPSSTPNDNQGSTEQENPTPEPEPEPEPIPEPEPLPEATYEFIEDLTARVYTFETNGLRNFYASFSKSNSTEVLFIDFYAPHESSYLPTGIYPLSDGSSMTCAQEYTYLTLETDGELLRFTEGSVTVIADPEHESGYTWYRIVALFTLPNGETVSLDFNGQLIPGQM